MYKRILTRLLTGQAIQSIREIEDVEFHRTDELTGKESRFSTLSVSQLKSLKKYQWPGFSSDFYFNSHWYGSLGRPLKWLVLVWIIEQVNVGGPAVEFLKIGCYLFCAIELSGIIFWPFFLIPSFAKAKKVRMWPSDLILNLTPGFRRWLFAPTALATSLMSIYLLLWHS